MVLDRQVCIEADKLYRTCIAIIEQDTVRTSPGKFAYMDIKCGSPFANRSNGIPHTDTLRLLDILTLLRCLRWVCVKLEYIYITLLTIVEQQVACALTSKISIQLLVV